MAAAGDPVAPVFREEWGRLVSGLIGWCGDWDLAEECAQEAFAEAVVAWPRDGRPDRPLAWLTTVARNRARDRLRRRTTEQAKLALIAAEPEPGGSGTDGALAEDGDDIPDDRLRLMFTCCHPALPMPSRVALTLRTLAGLTSAEIARAFLVTEPTMDKRLVRARAKIKHAGIPYRVPPPQLRGERLEAVLAVLYLLFNEGYVASSGEDVLRVDLSTEAIRLARVLHQLMPDESEATGLLALLLLTDARRPARLRGREIVPLAEQDRGLWQQDLIAEGSELLGTLSGPRLPDVAGQRVRPGPYEVQARIALVHDLAARPEDTDWRRIAALYDHLPATPVTELNRAVAVAMAEGPQRGLELVLPLETALSGYHLYFATRADFESRLGLVDAARADLRQAISLAPTGPERRLLTQRLATLG